MWNKFKKWLFLTEEVNSTVQKESPFERKVEVMTKTAKKPAEKKAPAKKTPAKKTAPVKKTAPKKTTKKK